MMPARTLLEKAQFLIHTRDGSVDVAAKTQHRVQLKSENKHNAGDMHVVVCVAGRAAVRSLRLVL